MSKPCADVFNLQKGKEFVTAVVQNLQGENFS